MFAKTNLTFFDLFVTVIVLFILSVNIYLYVQSNTPKMACINDDYKIFYSEVITGNSYEPLHYNDDDGNTHYNYGADVVMVNKIHTDEECQKYFAQ